MRAISSSVSLTLGMAVPGLIRVGSDIQRPRFDWLVASAPAAIERRLATWVRSGPVTPAAVVPAMAWHITQALERKRLWPLARSGVEGEGAGCKEVCRQAS